MLPWRLLRIALLTVGLALVARTARAEPTTFPQEARDRFEEGQELQDRGKLPEAIRAYNDAIRLGMKDYPRVHLYKARAYLQLKQYDGAIARYTRFLKAFSLEESCRH